MKGWEWPGRTGGRGGAWRGAGLTLCWLSISSCFCCRAWEALMESPIPHCVRSCSVPGPSSQFTTCTPHNVLFTRYYPIITLLLPCYYTAITHYCSRTMHTTHPVITPLLPLINPLLPLTAPAPCTQHAPSLPIINPLLTGYYPIITMLLPCYYPFLPPVCMQHTSLLPLTAPWPSHPAHNMPH